ncbi:unnamed protein product, partial [Rotaria sordida]
MSSSNAQAG